MLFTFFFFQAEDGIRVGLVTGVETCALPISHLTKPDQKRTSERPLGSLILLAERPPFHNLIDEQFHVARRPQIGRASCRERVEISVVVRYDKVIISISRKDTNGNIKHIIYH